ncbi:MAG: hypothetical protein IT355_09110 [Gemmatimonadaceae bacterium]|nr:hypothetical protein [Gemmatimonadaceae bacterium]
MADWLDDIMGGPDGPFSPMDPMEFNAPDDLVVTLIGHAVVQFQARRDEHLREQPLDEAGHLYHQQRVQSAINALAWARRQTTSTIRIGLYPMDVDSEIAMYEQLRELEPNAVDPELAEADEGNEHIDRMMDELRRSRPDERPE